MSLVDQAAITLFRLSQTVMIKALGLREAKLRIDGFEISYASRGNEGLPLVLVHGFASDRNSWNMLISKIKSRQRIIAIDLPGWGASSYDPQARYQLGDQAHRLEAVRKALGIERWHLAGISMGGGVSGTYAGLYPERVASLSLLDSAGIPGSRPAPFFIEVEAGRNPLIVRQKADLETLFAFVFLKRPQLPGWWERAMTLDYLKRLAIQEKLFVDLVADLTAVERHLPCIKAPIQVLWGRHDRVLDVSSVEKIRQLRPDAKLHIFEDCGHFPIMEKPRETADLLLSHVQRST